MTGPFDTPIRLNLQVDTNVDGIPPGSSAVKFGDPKMLDNVNNWLQEKALTLGPELAQNQIMQSFVKGLGLEDNPKALALTVPANGMGQVSGELGQPNVSSAGLPNVPAPTNLEIK
jgi:hypothetical protein